MNSNFKTIDEFYPTPHTLLEKMMSGINWRYVGTVLEPSAGKGDIADYVKEVSQKSYGPTLEIDCIEKDHVLRNTLKGAGYHVIHDDFLTFTTFKHYNLIAMNPPFSNGAKHLLKALELQKNGGAIVCILNAETLKNPCTNDRIYLKKLLNKYHAEIEYLEQEFSSAERKTDVEIALVKVSIEEQAKDSEIMERLKQRHYCEFSEQEMTDIALTDFVKTLVIQYNMEVEAGVSFIREYKALAKYMMSDFGENKYSSPILSLKLGKEDLSVNDYVKCVRGKYWRALFSNPKFMGKMTSNQREEYLQKVDTLKNYDISEYNINVIKEEMSKNLIHGIEDCIIKLFDELSCQYAYNPESGNVHYYNGWCSNKSWIINKRVVLPGMNAWSWLGGYDPCSWELSEKLKDIEKALNYLDGGLTEGTSIDERMRYAKENGITKKIECKFFEITFYKKGTCHIVFTDEDLLKKLNIFGSQKKGWLPHDYGNKAYSSMSEEEKAVIDEFEGEKEYNKTIANASYFLFQPENNLIQIEMAS